MLGSTRQRHGADQLSRPKPRERWRVQSCRPRIPDAPPRGGSHGQCCTVARLRGAVSRTAYSCRPLRKKIEHPEIDQDSLERPRLFGILVTGYPRTSRPPVRDFRIVSIIFCRFCNMTSCVRLGTLAALTKSASVVQSQHGRLFPSLCRSVIDVATSYPSPWRAARRLHRRRCSRCSAVEARSRSCVATHEVGIQRILPLHRVGHSCQRCSVEGWNGRRGRC